MTQLLGQFERERGSFARSVALRGQSASEFFGRQGAAVQTEAVTVFSGGKAMVEDAGQVLGRNAHTIIDYRDPDVVLGVVHPHDHLFVIAPGFIAGVLGVTDQVDEDLQNFVFIRAERGRRTIFPDHPDIVTSKAARVHAQRIFDQLRNLDSLDGAGNLGVALLHGDDIIDMIDVFAQ